jgi:hypothetical protein
LYENTRDIGIAVKDRPAVSHEDVDAGVGVRALQGADQRRRENRVSDPWYGNQEDTLHELILFDSAVVGNCSGDRAARPPFD